MKYFRDTDPDRHGGPIVGRSADGFPVRGAVAPYTTQEEFDELPLVADFKCRNFRMWVDDDREEYARVMDYVANGQFHLKDRVVVDEPGHGAPRVWLEWIQVYAMPERRPAGPALPGLPDAAALLPLARPAP